MDANRLLFTTLFTASIVFSTMVCADDLVTVKVRGTNIGILPRQVEVVTSEPRKHAAELYAKGATIRHGFNSSDS